jgi:hypothetical protein
VSIDFRAKLVVACIVMLLALTATASLTYAYDEPDHVDHRAGNCTACHPDNWTNCGNCHFGWAPGAGKGPHGLYSSTTDRCACCHDVHDATGALMLPGATVTSSCFTCHDGTGGMGVYGAIAARGQSVGARHRIDTTSAIPGGDPSTGGTSTLAFGGFAGNLGCDDCHSPHDASTVAVFAHERRRTQDGHLGSPSWPQPSNRLLRKHPAGSAATVTVYGSDWCLGCHAGRNWGGIVHNHPVDSALNTAAPFYYERAAILASDGPTTSTVLGSLAGTNRGYLMPMPRTSQQGAHKPICQQCHEDTRNAGTLNAAGNAADAATYSVTATDGNVATDNPRFQNFPHETQNARMLLEANDDLCTNCHPPAALP